MNIMNTTHTTNKRAILSFLAPLAFLYVFAFPAPAHAFTFQKNFLISDADLEKSSLSLKGIQSFLEEKGSVLADYITNDINGKANKVSRIIYDVSEKFSLNPMLFLVMAQKESSGITSSHVTYSIENWLLGYGRCDSCSEASAAKYRGMGRQLYYAAEKFRTGYLADLDSRGTTISGWGPGITKTTIDGIAVTPQNDATAALYTYNPCVGKLGGGYQQFGCNSAFQKLWEEWNPAAKYPDGSLLNINGTVYLIQKGKKRAFTSRGSLLANYRIEDIIGVSTVVGEKYPDGAPITYPNYSLLRNPKGTVYLLVDGEKRGIASVEVMKHFGFHPEEIIDVRWNEIDPIPEGKKITTQIEYPTGALLQNQDTGAVSYIDPDGKRHSIWAKSILKNRFANKPLQLSPADQIEQYSKSSPVTLRDGTLVTTKKSKKVFIISNGKRRAFKTHKVFTAFGYKKKNIITVSDKVLQLHQKGKVIKLQ